MRFCRLPVNFVRACSLTILSRDAANAAWLMSIDSDSTSSEMAVVSGVIPVVCRMISANIVYREIRYMINTDWMITKKTANNTYWYDPKRWSVSGIIGRHFCQVRINEASGSSHWQLLHLLPSLLNLLPTQTWDMMRYQRFLPLSRQDALYEGL